MTTRQIATGADGSGTAYVVTHSHLGVRLFVDGDESGELGTFETMAEARAAAVNLHRKRLAATTGSGSYHCLDWRTATHE